MKPKKTLENYLDHHYIHRSNWLRAAVLGANDGILSTASIAIGMAAATDLREQIALATLAGLVAGALSMAAGEYVSVSSQTDVEQADIEREKKELQEDPEMELQLLAQIYEQRGLKKETALKVALEFTKKDALAAHVRDELGINEVNQANPIQAALAFSSDTLFPSREYGNCTLYFSAFFLNHTRSNSSKNWRLKYSKSGFKNNLLGNNSDGFNCFCRVFIWNQRIRHFLHPNDKNLNQIQ
jgi:VIT1/CCC1 family predicted Fe2+/Mn2+ transporter